MRTATPVVGGEAVAGVKRWTQVVSTGNRVNANRHARPYPIAPALAVKQSQGEKKLAAVSEATTVRLAIATAPPRPRSWLTGGVGSLAMTPVKRLRFQTRPPSRHRPPKRRHRTRP